MKKTMTTAHEIKRIAAIKWDCAESVIIFGICLHMAHVGETIKKEIEMKDRIKATLEQFDNLDSLEALKIALDEKIKKMAPVSQKVTVTIENSSTSGNRKGWTKIVDSVDMEQKGGYAFEGSFLDDGEHEILVGSIIITCDPRGSVKNWWKEGTISRVQEDGTLGLIADEFDWYKEAVSFRNAVSEALNA